MTSQITWQPMLRCPNHHDCWWTHPYSFRRRFDGILIPAATWVCKEVRAFGCDAPLEVEWRVVSAKTPSWLGQLVAT